MNVQPDYQTENVRLYKGDALELIPQLKGKRIDAAIAGGVRRVSYDGKTVEYNSLDELRAALTEVKQGLASQAGATFNRQVKIVASKGL